MNSVLLTYLLGFTIDVVNSTGLIYLLKIYYGIPKNNLINFVLMYIIFEGTFPTCAYSTFLFYSFPLKRFQYVLYTYRFDPHTMVRPNQYRIYLHTLLDKWLFLNLSRSRTIELLSSTFGVCTKISTDLGAAHVFAALFFSFFN